VQEPQFDAELRAWPLLSFWYHLSFKELTSMPRWAVRLYLDELPKLRAEYELMLIEASGMAYMEEKDQKAVMKQLNADLGVREERQPEVSKETYMQQLAGLGLTIE
jgi:hypothetical protein